MLFDIEKFFGMEIGNGNIVNTKFSIDPTGPNYTISAKNKYVKQSLTFSIKRNDRESPSAPSPKVIRNWGIALLFITMGILASTEGGLVFGGYAFLYFLYQILKICMIWKKFLKSI